MRKQFIGPQRPVQQFKQVSGFQGLEDIDLATGEQGIDDFERRILRRGSDQDHRPVFHGPQQGVLLVLAETMDLVDEQDRSPLVGTEHGASVGTGPVQHFPDLFYAGTDG